MKLERSYATAPAGHEGIVSTARSSLRDRQEIHHGLYPAFRIMAQENMIILTHGQDPFCNLPKSRRPVIHRYRQLGGGPPQYAGVLLPKHPALRLQYPS